MYVDIPFKLDVNLEVNASPIPIELVVDPAFGSIPKFLSALKASS